MKTTILGLDVSSSCIGISILSVENETISYIHSEYHKPLKTGNLFERLDKTKKVIINIIQTYKPDIIAIEEIIQFMKGSSGAKTIIALTTFNRTIGLAAYETTSRPPEMYSVLQIRHGIRRAANLPKLPAKEELPDIIEKLLNFPFPWEYNKKGKKIVENYDRSDAICVGYYAALDLINKNKPIEPKKSKKKNGHKGSI
jgi:Holliday junction resolvasome RuvABC endonuclease subunit